MKHIAAFAVAALATLPAAPANAASGPFISLGNTDFIVLISFIIFVGALIYFKAPHFAGKLIDSRIDLIRKRIEDASSLKSEAHELLERMKKERAEADVQAKRIVEGAKKDAEIQIKQSAAEIGRAIERRMKAAEEQIQAAEAEAVASIRNNAIEVAVSVSGEVIKAGMDSDDRKKMIDRSFKDIDTYLN